MVVFIWFLLVYIFFKVVSFIDFLQYLDFCISYSCFRETLWGMEICFINSFTCFEFVGFFTMLIILIIFSLSRAFVFIVDFQFNNRFVFSVWLSSSEFS